MTIDLPIRRTPPAVLGGLALLATCGAGLLIPCLIRFIEDAFDQTDAWIGPVYFPYSVACAAESLSGGPSRNASVAEPCPSARCSWAPAWPWPASWPWCWSADARPGVIGWVLDDVAPPCDHPASSRRAGCERDEYPSCVGTEIRWLVETGATTAGNGPGSLRTERSAPRRRGADPVGSGAERQRYRAAPIGPDRVQRRIARRSWSAASPNEGGTAEGTTFRPGTTGRFLIPGPDVTGPRATRPDRPHGGRTR